MDRRILQRSLIKQERSTWIEQLPRLRRVEIPEKGDIVVYFAEGHREALKHSHRFRAPVWGVDPPQDDVSHQ